MTSPTILLIHPPAVSPSMPSWDAALVAGSLCDSRLNPVHYDANLDFFLTHLLSREQMDIHFLMIQEKYRSGKISNEKYDQLKNIYEMVCETETETDLDGFKRQDFFDPQRFIHFKKTITSLLTLASYAYSPVVFHWGGYESGPGISFSGDISFSKEIFRSGTESSNPFLQLCIQGLDREFCKHDPETVILFVSSPDQIQASETMAGFIKSHYPETMVLTMTNLMGVFEKQNKFDHVVQGQGKKGLAMLINIINNFHGTKIDSMNSIPDFKGMPLDKYLIPELILPVQPGFFNDPFCLSDFLEDQVKNFAAKGFMFQDDFPMPANSDGLLDSTDQQHPGGLEQGAGNHPGRIYGLLDHWLSIKHPKTFFSIPIQIPTQMATGFSTGESGQIPSLIPSQISGELQSLENKFPDLFLSGLRMIRWKRDNGNDKIPMKVLWAASKQGIWNHLTGPNLFRDPCWPIKSGQSEQSHQAVQARVIANNPNIIHSYQDTARKFPGDEYGNPKVPLEFMDYGKVQPLPGIPFWQSLDDPAFLLIYLSRMTRKSLGCLRADISNQSVITLGSQMNFFYQSPSDLPQGILDEICKMVDAGGSVDSKYVRSNLEKAYLIGYAMENGVILGNSCLKHPRQEFIQRINQITDLDLTNFVERGYTSVRPECRSLGVGAKLLEGLTKRAKDRKIFSIISEDNLATQKIALRNNTRKILTYFSEKLDKKMGMWMPEHMIEDKWELKK